MFWHLFLNLLKKKEVVSNGGREVIVYKILLELFYIG